MKRIVRFVLTLILFAPAFANAQAIQKVLVEEHTGAWCGYCPDGALIMTDILNTRPNAIGVAIHQGDAMNTAEGTSIRSFYSPAFPQATINRTGAPLSRGSWAAEVDNQLAGSANVTVSFDSVVYDVSTRILTCRVKSTWHVEDSGQFRFNVYLSEDNLTGTGSAWDQVNYFDSTQGHPYYQAGNPIVGYVHNHTFRTGLGGAWGTPLAIPQHVYPGEEFTHTYQKYIPQGSGWDLNNMHLIAMVNRHGGQLIYQRPTLNSEEMPFSVAIGIDGGLQASSNVMDIYPNPASERVTVAYTLAETGKIRVEILNQLGQQVITLVEGITNSGAHTAYWDGQDQSGQLVANGLYIARLVTENGQSLTKKIIIER